MTLTHEKLLKPKPVTEINISILTIKEIIDIVCKNTGVSVANLKSDSRRQDIIITRNLAVFFAYYYGKKQLIDIAYYNDER